MRRMFLAGIWGLLLSVMTLPVSGQTFYPLTPFESSLPELIELEQGKVSLPTELLVAHAKLHLPLPDRLAQQLLQHIVKTGELEPQAKVSVAQHTSSTAISDFKNYVLAQKNDGTAIRKQLASLTDSQRVELLLAVKRYHLQKTERLWADRLLKAWWYSNAMGSELIEANKHAPTITSFDHTLRQLLKSPEEWSPTKKKRLLKKKRLTNKEILYKSILIQKEQPKSALYRLKRMSKKFKGKLSRPLYLWVVANYFRSQDDKSHEAQVLAELRHDFAEHPLVLATALRLSQLYRQLDQESKAIEVETDWVKEHPFGDAYLEILSRLMIEALTRGDRQSAQTYVTTLLAAANDNDSVEAYGLSWRAKALYWQAQLTEDNELRHKRLAEVFYSYPFEYHGVAAQIALQKPSIPYGIIDRGDPIVDQWVTAFRFGFGSPLYRLLTRSLDKEALRGNQQRLALSATTEPLTMPNGVIYLAGVPLDKARAHFAMGFQDEIVNAAKSAEIPAVLLAAICYIESRFQPDARSPAGAVGLCQLMPNTAQAMAKKRYGKAFLRSELDEKLRDPTTNLELAATLLRGLLERFEGNALLAIAAYNAGAAPATRWQTAGDKQQSDLFIEQITYRNTRRYVKRVLAQMKVYQVLFDFDVTKIGGFQRWPLTILTD